MRARRQPRSAPSAASAASEVRGGVDVERQRAVELDERGAGRPARRLGGRRGSPARTPARSPPGGLTSSAFVPSPCRSGTSRDDARAAAPPAAAPPASTSASIARRRVIAGRSAGRTSTAVAPRARRRDRAAVDRLVQARRPLDQPDRPVLPRDARGGRVHRHDDRAGDPARVARRDQRPAQQLRDELEPLLGVEVAAEPRLRRLEAADRDERPRAREVGAGGWAVHPPMHGG